MSYEALQQAVAAVEAHNRDEDGQWKYWEDAADITDTYAIKGLTAPELAILERAIESNGATLAEDMAKAAASEK